MSKEKLKKLTTKIQIPKSNHGITLVALIITIVIMLILVGVTLSIALGENGIISTAKEAKNKTEIAAEKEKLQDAVFATIGSNGEVNLEDIVLPEGFTEVEGFVSYASKKIYQGPSGQQYEVENGTGKITEVDGEIAVAPDDLKGGYKVTYGDYEYTYNSSNQGWSVAVLDKTKEEYGEIATAIYGKPIISLNPTFRDCTNMKIAPEIPSGVTSLGYAFQNCSSLIKIPEIPSGVTSMDYAFWGCTSIDGEVTVPSGVKSLVGTFRECTSLTEMPEIPSGVTSMDYAFWGCTSIDGEVTVPSGVKSLVGTFRDCRSLTVPPKLSEGVTNLSYAFFYCSALTTAPEIPSTVTSLSSTFQSCVKLQGEITINASPETYSNCFHNAGGRIILKGSSTVLNELAATNTRGNVTVGN